LRGAAGARPAVKICGICHPRDAALVESAGADYLGVILAPGRSRSRTLEEAASIFAMAPAAKRVGVFVDAPAKEVREAALRLNLAVVQLHGEEPPELLSELRGGATRIWKAIRPRTAEDFLGGVERYAHQADAILLDGWSAEAPGGTGARFPWDEVAAVRDHLPDGVRLVIAGGLHPGNLAVAAARLAPEIVDVSSGVESAIGVKDPELVRGFVAAARELSSRGI
jgi:phosphoribosylanthranilate isomerase